MDSKQEGQRTQDELSSFYEQAVVQLGQRNFAEALQLWETIQQSKGDLNYADTQNVEARAKEGLCADLYSQALGALVQRKPRQALALWAQVLKIDPHYPDSQEVKRQVQEGISQCEEWYAQARESLDQKDPQHALVLWNQILEIDPQFPDEEGIGRRANKQVAGCTIWYDQAKDALAQQAPYQALELWERVRQITPHYPDSQDVEKRARQMIARQEAEGARRKRSWIIIAALIGIGLLLVLAVLFASGVFSSSPAATDTPTPTLLPSPRPKTATPTPTASPEPTEAPTQTPESTATATPTVTTTPTPTTPPTPTPTEAPPDLATAVQSSSIFEAPSSASRELAVIGVGETVAVLGRSASGGWFYVRDDQGAQGFAYASRFEWPGDFESLPIQDAVGTPPPVTPSPRPTSEGSYPPLTMDFWQLDGTQWCAESAWHQSVWIRGQGGDGVYTYYRDGELLAGPLSNEGYSFEVSSASGAIILKGRVVSGDGQAVEMDLYVPEPDCD
jgi:tetratricopeptide (TPR) repeat protein